MAKITCNKQNFICFEDLPLGAAFLRFEDVRQSETPHVYVKISPASAVVVCGGFNQAYSQHPKTFVFSCKVTAVEIS